LLTKNVLEISFGKFDKVRLRENEEKFDKVRLRENEETPAYNHGLPESKD
jgi:hypothetical protein